MRNIIVVDAVSTGYNYVEDIIRRGYSPVVLEPHKEATDEMEALKAAYKEMYHEPVFIQEQDSYEATLELVRSYDPVQIVAGSEAGVVLTTRLAEDLGLPGNPYANIDAMTRKDGMQNALRDAGLRYILGEKVSSVEEAMAFCKENKLDCAVVKPLQSAGSQGLFLCDDLDEVRSAVAELLTMDDIFGRPIREVLVQERIFGTEYIVNTVSSEGVHRLNSVLRYKKTKTPEGGYIYDYMETIKDLESGNNELIEYALKTADAIGFRNGIIHGEYMIDSKGPVLIEVNCRPMGCSLPDIYLDLIFGQHETDSALDSLLDHEKFLQDAAKPYRPLRKGYLKMIMIPEDIEAEDHPIWEIARQLRSTYKISANANETVVRYKKTRDLETNGGMIYMVNDDEHVLESDLALLRRIEDRYFKLLLNDGMSRRWFVDSNEPEPDLRKIITDHGCRGAVLVAADKEMEIEGAQCVTPDTLSEANVGFDYVIVGYQHALTERNESECLRLMFDTMGLVRDGGMVIIPQTTYDYLSYKREGAEELMTIKGLTVEAPRMGCVPAVCGTRQV